MKIISHRGYWLSTTEKNSETAFMRSFSKGFGTETDIRDCAGKLVISHDMPRGDEVEIEAFLGMAYQSCQSLTLALNIKADGLTTELGKALAEHPSLDCFVFDMSVPDMRCYLESGIPVFTRMSEVEREPVWLSEAAGVWLDGFEGIWFDNQVIEKILDQNKRLCVVSSELHGRDQMPLWEQLRPLSRHSGLILCTDQPVKAQSFFEGF